MDNHRLLSAGLKLIGIYCAVYGLMNLVTVLITTFWIALSSWPQPRDTSSWDRFPILINFLLPAACWAMAYVLIRKTPWCVRKITADTSG